MSLRDQLTRRRLAVALGSLFGAMALWRFVGPGVLGASQMQLLLALLWVSPALAACWLLRKRLPKTATGVSLSILSMFAIPELWVAALYSLLLLFGYTSSVVTHAAQSFIASEDRKRYDAIEAKSKRLTCDEMTGRARETCQREACLENPAGHDCKNPPVQR